MSSSTAAEQQSTLVPGLRDPLGSSGGMSPLTERLLGLALVAIFVFPADMVLSAVGAVGYTSMLAAYVLFGLWVGGTLLGQNNPLLRPSPARLGLGALWIVSIVAYVATPPEFSSVAQRAAADRWTLLLCGMSGIVLTMSDGVRTMRQVASVVRALSVGAAFCAAAAIVQFVTFTDPFDHVRSIMVGFTENGGNTTFQIRSPFVRVAGSTFSPIELGVVSSMVLPLAVWRALFDETPRRRWPLLLQVGLIGVAAVMTVSRSAILSLFLVAVIFIPFLPTTARRWAALIAPLAGIAVFLVLPGFVSTIVNAFGAGTSDPSLETRVNNWPRVEAMVSAHPWSGQGPGSYQPSNALQILDNQYLNTAVTMGLLGVVGLVLFYGLPLIASLQVAVSSRDPALRCLAGATAAGGAVALVASATFDAFSFPVFVTVNAAVLGFSAVVWNFAVRVPTASNTAGAAGQDGVTHGSL